MYKIVLVALFAAAIADPEPEPGALIAPYPGALTYSSWYSPATTTITKSASSVVAPSPYIYSSPYYPHFIKKREANPGALYAGGYISPYSYNGYNGYNTPYLSPALGAPLVHNAPLLSPALTYSAPAHYIKKRSAILPSTYIAPVSAYAATAPLYTSTYTAAAPLYPSAPLYSSPLGYSHYIKKRSVGALPYLAPTTYGFPAGPLVTSPYAASPYIAGSPYIAASPYLGYPFIKK